MSKRTEFSNQQFYISKSDFEFRPVDEKRCLVTYTSATKIKRSWDSIITDMELVNSVMNKEKPLKRDMIALKTRVKKKDKGT